MEEGSSQKTRWAKNGGAQAEEEEGAIAKWSPNANGLKTEEERLPGETQRLPHARGGDPSHTKGPVPTSPSGSEAKDGRVGILQRQHSNQLDKT